MVRQVKHILQDGREVDSVKGIEVPTSNAVYGVLLGGDYVYTNREVDVFRADCGNPVGVSDAIH